MTLESGIALAVFIVVCFAVSTMGAIFRPGDWYDNLNKPSWQPPSWLFAPVWSILYVMIAVSGWLVWREHGLAGASFAFVVYGIQLVVNGAWSPVFFGLKRPDLALIEVGFLWLSVVATIWVFAPLNETATWLLVPYLVWVSFASFLNFTIVRLNPRYRFTSADET